MEKTNRINVTQPSLPDIKDFYSCLEEIWNKKWLTNNGPFHEEFEKDLAEYLGVKHVSLFANGTLALVAALQVLRITGEVITTPFSFVATTHALWWNNIKPVFVDIEENYCNIDTEKIEAAITPQTTAILPVHVYGNPCDVDALQKIADTYGLKVIYDAAHAFGVEYSGTSVLNYGDLSVLSFHATKPFNTMEGGAIISHDQNMKTRIDYLKNFGYVDETIVVAPGINSKMNEMQAALGLLQLKEHAKNIAKRKRIDGFYRENLQGIPGIKVIKKNADIEKYPYPYFPVFVDKKEYGRGRDELYEHLKEFGIFGRRYFYPLISSFPTYRGLKSSNRKNLEIAYKKTEQVFCLPIYSELPLEIANKIVKIIKEFGR